MFVEVRLKAPKAILPAVKVNPVAFETETLLPKVKVVDALFIVMPVNAKGFVAPNKEPVIVPEPPTSIGPIEEKVAVPKAIGPFKDRVLFPPIAIVPAVEL